MVIFHSYVSLPEGTTLSTLAAKSPLCGISFNWTAEHCCKERKCSSQRQTGLKSSQTSLNAFIHHQPTGFHDWIALGCSITWWLTQVGKLWGHLHAGEVGLVQLQLGWTHPLTHWAEEEGASAILQANHIQYQCVSRWAMTQHSASCKLLELNQLQCNATYNL